MSSPLFLVLPLYLLLLFFSSQSCQARRLRISPDDNDPTRELDISNKNQANIKVEVQPVRVAAVKPIDEKVGSGKQEGNLVPAKKTTSESRELPGAESVVSTSHVVKRQLKKLEGPTKLEQYSAGEFHVSEGAAESTELDVSDIVVMDYPQPHRKPPINNKAP
ncbi:uncharacterized protein LOC116266258 [Nymphaea colorata]|nr:uncharacterized protein LOC116266258 [Nymphaea colorata]